MSRSTATWDERRTTGASPFAAARRALALAAAVALSLAALFAGPPPSAQAAPGGLSSPGLAAESPPPPAAEADTSTLVGEEARPPLDAPPAVRAVIAAANRISSTPYVWGGGHGRWWDRGYDCSGSVSYALHGGGLLESPLVSGSFMTWGEPGPGAWITIYANRKHVYAVIAGLRWDTGGDPAGVTGPRWHAEPPYPKGFVVRHPSGY